MKLTPLIVSSAPLLRAVAQGGWTGAKPLAEAAGRHANNLNADLRALHKAGLVEWPDGAKAWQTTVTPAGHEGLAALARAEVEDDPRNAEAVLPVGWVLLHSGQIAFDPHNARQRMDAAALEELAQSIADRGLQQNLVVRPPATPGGHYRLIAGERRLRAIRALQEGGRWPDGQRILCKVEAGDDLEADVAALHENLQREDLHPLDQALAYQRLATVHGLGSDEIARRVRRSQRHVQDYLRMAGMREDLKHRMRLPEEHPNHLGPTAVRELLTRPKAREIVAPPGPATSPQPGPHATPPGQAAPIQPPRFSTGGNNVTDVRKRIEADQAEKAALAALDLDPHTRLALLELAHKLETQPAPGFSTPQALTHEHWLDANLRTLRQEGLARILPTREGHYAVLTLKGQRKLEMERAGKVGPISDLELHAARAVVGHADWPVDGGYVSLFLRDPSCPSPATRQTDDEADGPQAPEAANPGAGRSTAAVEAECPPPPDLAEACDTLSNALRVLILIAEGQADWLVTHQDEMAAADPAGEWLILRRAIAAAEDALHRAGAQDYACLDQPGQTTTSPTNDPTAGRGTLRSTDDPAVPVRDSISADHLVCLEDGLRFRCLTRHLRTRYGLSPDQYRARWGLPADYPVAAPNVARRLDDLARSLGVSW